MTQAAADLHARTGRTGGNGSLMRTGPVALAHLDDPDEPLHLLADDVVGVADGDTFEHRHGSAAMRDPEEKNTHGGITDPFCCAPRPEHGRDRLEWL